MSVKANAVGKIIVFSAASGAGKTMLLSYLKQSIPGLVYSISATTRKPRIGEISGSHYFFMTEDEFKQRLSRNEFAEWAVVHGNYYGTPRSFIDETINAGNHIIMDIDVFGKKKFDVVYPEAIGVLVLPPSLEVLEERLRSRKSDDEATIQLRLANARKEMDFAATTGKYEYTLINGEIEKAKLDAVTLVSTIIGKSSLR